MVKIYTAGYGKVPCNKKYSVEHQLGLSLLAQGLAEVCQIQVSQKELEDMITVGDYGKPYFKEYPDIHFNISHCDGMVVCALSDSPVGIDVENIGEVKDHILPKVLTPGEQEFLFQYRQDTEKYKELFYRFWTLKESRIKQNGCGFTMPLTDISFILSAEEHETKIECSDKTVFFAQKMIEDKYILSVCSAHPYSPEDSLS